MTKRQMWLMNCWVWAGIWFVLGVFFFPFWLFTVLSVMLIMLPVGVSDNPAPKHIHNPNEWNKHDGQ